MSSLTPLESNPDVLTKYIHKLGVSDAWALTDVVGLEPEMLSWLPKPVKAIILLFPCSEEYEKHRAAEEELLTAEPQEHPESLFYMRQVTHNACGTVALIHSIANNNDIELSDGVLKKFLDKAKSLSPEERGKALENDEAFTATHEALAQEGQTPADPAERVNHHFIAFVNVEDLLYELDGRKTLPVQHGSTTSETFVDDAAKVCKTFMERDPDEVRFTIMALATNQN